ncbi:MAG: magnesium-translocating P-type ATPase [Clostridia bacterium]|jgi:magnesium-importing ATPase
MSQKIEEFNVKKEYGDFSLLPKNEFISKYNINFNGLTDSDILENQKTYGKNEISGNKPKRWYNYFFESLFSPFNAILLGISLVLIYTDIVLPQNPNPANIIVIICLVLVSTLLEFFQEFRSNKAAEKLKAMVQTKGTVIRNCTKQKIPFKDFTVGDIVLLSAGDMVPADLRVLESKDLFLGQSSITGESDSIKKIPNSLLKSIDELESITDLDNICFMGTNVISGSAKCAVIKVADNTYFGKVAHSITSGKPKTEFQKGIENISKLLTKFMLFMIPLTFIVNVWKHDLLTAFTFSVAIAIGITPLLLPVILSSCLSKGAVQMSKKKTIVKKLDSVESFGSMNVFCTDKTGTLTEDKIVLEKYLDIYGNEDISVLEDAFLNSYHQTGLDGNIDKAVINRALENGLEYLKNDYLVVDEIPFDFSRRRLSVIVADKSNNKKMITKGAVEEILNICTKVSYNNQIFDITNEIKKNIKKISVSLNKDGLRVIAICKKNVTSQNDFSVNDESNMILTGFIGFLDPPKESAAGAIKRMNEAGIRVIVLTGDNAEVTGCICKKVGIKTSKIILGSEIDKLPDSGVIRLLKRKHNVFAKLSPIQKARIIRLLKVSGNVVGYMGDGINDTPSLTNSDVGVSVDTAVDIAKETADIILLEKDLNVLLDGVTEGRKTFSNLLKYIKLAVSFNFGEVTSVLIASILLPFFPITPIQLLVQSLLYDIGQLTLPFDNVDIDSLKKPKKWSISAIRQFMIFMGPLSSAFDLIVFAMLWFVFKLGPADSALFQTIWFSYGIVSNLFGMHIIRTAKIPFVQSHASKPVYMSSIIVSLLAILVPFTPLGTAIGLVAIPIKYMALIFLTPVVYCIIAQFAKYKYIQKHGEWL